MHFLPNVPLEIVDLIYCSSLIIFVYLTKKFSMPKIANVSLVGIGIVSGNILNGSLSMDFLASPSFFSLSTESITVLVALITIFQIIGHTNLYEKVRYIFLGVSLISILFALSTFISVVQSYLPIYPTEGTGISVMFKFSLIVNILKSLFLTGLFSFFERFLRIMEESKSPLD